MVANTHIFTRAFSVADCIDAVSCAASKGAFFVAATAFDVAIAAQVVAIAAHIAAIAAIHSEDICEPKGTTIATKTKRLVNSGYDGRDFANILNFEDSDGLGRDS